MNMNELSKELAKKDVKLSKAKEVRALIQKQKGLLKAKQSLTSFEEPVLFLVRRNGKMELYEKATAGRFPFEHSNGSARFLDLRPADQVTFPYGDKRVRAYVAHEDRPFGGWDDPVVDSEDVMLGYEKTKATDLKYQERLKNLDLKGKQMWVWYMIGFGGFIAIVGMAYSIWIGPALAEKARSDAAIVAQTAGAPVVQMLLLLGRDRLKRFFSSK